MSIGLKSMTRTIQDTQNLNGKKICKKCQDNNPETEYFLMQERIQEQRIVLKSYYYLCKSCYTDKLTVRCNYCDSKNIDFNFHLGFFACKACGSVLGDLLIKSHKEKRDYVVNEPKDFEFALKEFDLL